MSYPEYRSNPDRLLSRIESRRMHLQWVRENADAFGLDCKKMVLGDVLGGIIGDDENLFGIGDEIFAQPNEAFQSLKEILDWETQVPEIPNNLRKQLNAAQKVLFGRPWKIQSDVAKGFKIWKQEVKDFTCKHLEQSLFCWQAVQYNVSHTEVLDGAWLQYQVREGYLLAQTVV